MKEALDFLIARLGMTPSEILAHQIEPGLEQVERRPERVGDRRRCGWHSGITAAHAAHSESPTLGEAGRPQGISKTRTALRAERGVPRQ